MSFLPPDILRQGAAMCQALYNGDMSARLPYSDFLLEHGLPTCTGVLLPSPDTWNSAWNAVHELRLDLGRFALFPLARVTFRVLSPCSYHAETYLRFDYNGPVNEVWLGSYTSRLFVEDKLFSFS